MSRTHVSGTGYVLTYLGLLLLAGLSLGLSFLHWPAGDLVASLAIATVKAFLVLWFFMHLTEQRFANRLVVSVTVLFLLLLVSLTVVDVATRRTMPPRPIPANQLYER